MRSILFFIVFALCGIAAAAQKQNAEIIADPRVDLLLDKHIYLSRHQSTLDGWRIQIFFDSGANSKRRATDVLNRFASKYDNCEAYLSFKEPYYRVRIGDFRSRLEAEGFLQIIKAQYPNAFTVNDKINPPNLPAQNDDRQMTNDSR